jgi:hypothetical protein
MSHLSSITWPACDPTMSTHKGRPMRASARIPTRLRVRPDRPCGNAAQSRYAADHTVDLARLVQRLRWDGRHDDKTANAWLANVDARCGAAVAPRDRWSRRRPRVCALADLL